MAIKRPDIYEHNNPVLAIVDSDFLKGGGRVVADLTALYALSSRPDQLKERVTRVYVTAESAYYVLVDDSTIGTSAGWEVESSGGGTWGSITGTLSDQTDLQSALDAKEDTITATTSADYYRGDKTFATLDKAAVGLSNVDNTSDADKPVSTATQTALDAKQATITGAATTIDTEDLTASRALVSDASGKVAVSDVTSTELGYLDGVTSAVQTQVDAKTAKLITTNRQTASYTLVLGDADKLVEMNVATANDLTIPLNSSVAFATGTQILLAQYGAGQTTIVPTSGVTVNSNGAKLKLNVQYSGATLIKIGTDEWYLFGDIVA
jgi:hypothetical protein